jgi:hypothetical protein
MAQPRYPSGWDVLSLSPAQLRLDEHVGVEGLVEWPV